MALPEGENEVKEIVMLQRNTTIPAWQKGKSSKKPATCLGCAPLV